MLLLVAIFPVKEHAIHNPKERRKRIHKRKPKVIIYILWRWQIPIVQPQIAIQRYRPEDIIYNQRHKTIKQINPTNCSQA